MLIYCKLSARRHKLNMRAKWRSLVFCPSGHRIAGRSEGMLRAVKKVAIFSLAACIISISVPLCTIAAVQELNGDEFLQPQGLDITGVYALKQIAPALTGDGVVDIAPGRAP